MDEDISSTGWPARAGCRWASYSVLWAAATAAGVLSAFHPVLCVFAAILGLLLAISVPLMFATLFERALSRRSRHDMAFVFMPMVGSCVVLLGMLCLILSSENVVSRIDSATVETAGDLLRQYAGSVRNRLPRTVCIHQAFVLTGWEAAKDECHQRANGAGVQCDPAFVAAPVFDSFETAMSGKSDEVHAWAVSQGTHVDANYRRDGSLCAFMSGINELDLHLGEYNLAIARVIFKRNLHRTQMAKSTADLGSNVPLEARPVLLVQDPATYLHVEQVLLAVAVVLLAMCPCTGPAPIAMALLFFCWAGRGVHGGRQVLPQDDEDFEFLVE